MVAIFKWLPILLLLGGDVQAQSVFGIASTYCDKRTALGERMNCKALTAAHRKLPLGSRVTVVNLRNGKTVVVHITDRGPAKRLRKRIIDLSSGAAKSIGLNGLAPVKIITGIGL